ncbi:hypothetical protein [Paractinoplanes durhamensis]|uniref:hypothetical protein n=1 Tax=Paractinoplanes durhamensis TaxID=113563 RepID=UPI00363460C1
MLLTVTLLTGIATRIALLRIAVRLALRITLLGITLLGIALLVAARRLRLAAELALRRAALPSVDRSRPAPLVRRGGPGRRLLLRRPPVVADPVGHVHRPVPGRLVALLRRRHRATAARRRPLLVGAVVALHRGVVVPLRRLIGSWLLGGFVNRRVDGLATAGIARVALTGQRLPFPGDLVDPGRLVAPPVVAELRAPAVHRAPIGRPGDWQRSVTAQSTSRSENARWPSGDPGRVSRLHCGV